MRMPFAKLMELVEALSPEDQNLPLGELAARWGEPVSRITDAIDAVKVVHGITSYITVDARTLPARNDRLQAIVRRELT